MKNQVKECNVAVQDLLAQGMQRLFDDAEHRASQRSKRRPDRPILALPLIDGNISLGGVIIEHRSRAVLVSNDTTEVWIPRSHVRRVVGKNQIIVSAWIAAKKSFYLHFIENLSPEYQAWKADEPRRQRDLAEWIRNTGGFQYKFDGPV